MIDVTIAISVGIITSILCGLFYAVNLFHYKIQTKKFDRVFWFVAATVVLFLSVFFANMAYIAGRYPDLDYHGWFSESSYMPYTKTGVLISILIYIRAFTGDAYPYVWLYCSGLSLMTTILAYIYLT